MRSTHRTPGERVDRTPPMRTVMLRMTARLLLLTACALVPAASAAAADKPYIVVYDPVSAAGARATTSELVKEQDLDTTARFSTTVKGFAADLSSHDVAELRDDPR